MCFRGTREVLALGVCLTTLAVLGAPAWSEPRAWLAGLSPEAVVDALSGADTHVSLLATDLAIPPPDDPELSLFTTSAADRGITDVRLLVTEGDRWRLMEVGAAVTLRPLNARLTAFSQLPYVVTEPRLPDVPLENEPGPAAVGFTARVGGFEAGAQYRSVGKQLERLVGAAPALKDREGHEVWVAQRLGVLRLRLSDSELTDNVDRNPALPRTTRDQTALAAEVALADWPVLGLTLASGDSERFTLTGDARDRQRAQRSDDPAVERHEFESVTASAYYYGGPAWSVAASSTFSRSRHATRPAEGMAMAYHDLSLTLHPHESLTLTPMLGLGQERYEPSGYGIDRGTAAVGVSYAPRVSPWSGWSYASYTRASASDGSTAARGVSLSGGLTYGLGRWLPGCAVSVQAAYDRYDDAAVPASAGQAVSAFVLFKVATF